MASSQVEIDKTKKRSKYQYPAKYPVIDGIRYLPNTTREFLKDIKNLPVKGDEVFVVSSSKAGKIVIINQEISVFFAAPALI